jgi:hypothetical protein
MKRRRTFIFIAASSWLFFAWASLVHAGVLGVSPEDMSNGIDQFLQKHAWHWVCALGRLVAQFCMNCLFKVYQFLGTRTLFIPDIASPKTWLALGSQQAPQSVTNVIHIMVGIGLMVGLIASTVYLGQIGFGSSKHQLSRAVFLRIVVPVVCITCWPFWTSFTCRLSSNTAILIYSQNSFITNGGAFSSLTNFDVTTDTGGQGVAQQNERTNFLYEFNLGKVFAWSFAMFLCVMGLYWGWNKTATGNGGGFAILATAGLCLVLITLLPSIYTYLNYNVGVGNLAQTSQEAPLFSSSGVLPTNPAAQLNLPQESHPIIQIGQPRVAPQDPNPDPVKYPNDTWSNLLNSGIQTFVALFGILICIAILIAKGYQVVMLILYFFLMFAFFGCYGHPDWEDLTFAGAWAYIKLLFQNVIWGVGFYLLNLIPHLNWTPTGQAAGQGTIMTAFGLLSALMVIQNSKDIADVFTKTKSHFEGSAGQIFRDVTRVMGLGLGGANLASRVLEASTGQIGQKVAGGVGGGVGAATGALGGLLIGNPTAGAKLGMKVGSTVGQQSTKAVNAVSKTLGKATSGNPFRPGNNFASMRQPKGDAAVQGAPGQAGSSGAKDATPKGPQVNAMRFGSRNAGGSTGFRQSPKNNPGRGPQGPTRPPGGGPTPSFKK